jgi:adenosine deaminase CECR1
MPDDEWEEVVQTVPSVEEPFIQKYLSGRDALIAQEKKQRSGITSLYNYYKDLSF